jgi:maltose O-acetyltransferase
MNLVEGALLDLLSSLWDKWHIYQYRLRIRKLVAQGLTLGKNVTIAPTAYIDSGYPYLISIGNNSSVANEARLLAHDAAPFKFAGGHARLGKIEIRDNCFIGDRAIILPGVTIGPNVLVAAGSVVNRDIPPNSCVAGIPARFYASFDDFIARHKEQLKVRDVYEYSDLHPKMDEALRRKVWESAQNGDIYVKGYAGKYPHTLNMD